MPLINNVSSGIPRTGMNNISDHNLTDIDITLIMNNFNGHSLPSRAVDSYWWKYVYLLLVNRLGSLSLPRKSVSRLTNGNPYVPQVPGYLKPISSYILRNASGFWKYCKTGVGWIFISLKSHLFIKNNIAWNQKYDIMCFSLNNVFLIDPKNDDCAEEKHAHRLFVLRFGP